MGHGDELVGYGEMSVYVDFFFNDTATTEIYTLSLHDALPIYRYGLTQVVFNPQVTPEAHGTASHVRNEYVLRVSGLVRRRPEDRKSTRLNSSHANISYAVFCLKKKRALFRRLSL